MLGDEWGGRRSGEIERKREKEEGLMYRVMTVCL
jgi:hypothetical protein